MLIFKLHPKQWLLKVKNNKKTILTLAKLNIKAIKIQVQIPIALQVALKLWKPIKKLQHPLQQPPTNFKTFFSLKPQQEEED